MGLFTRKPKRQMTSVLDIIDIDLSTYPDESFEDIGEEINAGGAKTKRWLKQYGEQELLGVFSKLEIVTFEDSPAKNFLFGCEEYDELNLQALKKLVNSIAEIYGKDDSEYGRFSSQDAEEIEDDLWSGRMWGDEKYPTACSVSYYEEEGAAMTIWTT